jgi:hypothetical protein
LDQFAAQSAIAAMSDVTTLYSISGGAFGGSQTDEPRLLAHVADLSRVTDTSQQMTGHNLAYSRNAFQMSHRLAKLRASPGWHATRLYFESIERGTVRLERFDREWALPTYKIACLLVIAFAAVVAYPYIPGSSSEAFKGVSIFLGVMFSLGSSSIIANLMAGYTMIYRRAFKVGDRIASTISPALSPRRGSW